MIIRGRVEDTRLEAKDTKKSDAKAKDSLSEADPLEAKNRNARSQGQGPRTQLQVFSKEKKRGLQKSFSNNLQFLGEARIFDWGEAQTTNHLQ